MMTRNNSRRLTSVDPELVNKFKNKIHELEDSASANISSSMVRDNLFGWPDGALPIIGLSSI